MGPFFMYTLVIRVWCSWSCCTCSYYEYIFSRKVVGVFSHKGFPKVKYGVYYASLFMWYDVMHLPSNAFTIMFTLLLHCSCLWLILSMCNHVMMDDKFKILHVIIHTWFPACESNKFNSPYKVKVNSIQQH